MKKQLYTMEDFRKGGLAVAIRNERERDRFLSMCKKSGLLWESGDEATEYLPPTVPPYKIECGCFRNGKLTWDRDTTGAISLSQITGRSEAPHYQILIDCDDNKTTVARLLVNGREVKRREATCHPSDSFSLRKGAAMAFGRLWDKQVKTEKEQAVREVQRYAKANEWIKIVEPMVSCGRYHKGNILPVSCADEDGRVTVSGITVCILPREYVVLEGYKPEGRCK